MVISWFAIALCITATESATTTEVHITGSKSETLRRSSGSSATISEQDLYRAKPASVSEVLRRVPGLQVRQEDQSGFRLNLGVRGLNPARSRLVLIEEDGIPLVVSPYGEPELYYTTAIERVQRVTVTKGSDVLTHGPQTVGAYIQLQTWEPTTTPTWYASVTGGTYRFGEAIGRFSDTVGDLSYVVQAFDKFSDGVRRMGYRSTDAFAKAVYKDFRLKVGFHDDRTNTTYTGITQEMFEERERRDTAAPDDRFNTRRYEIGLAYEHRFRSAILKASVFAYAMQLHQRLQNFDRARQPDENGNPVTYAREFNGLYFLNTNNVRDRTYNVVGGSTELMERFTTGVLQHKLTVGVRAIGDFARRRLYDGSSPKADSGPLLTRSGSRILGLSAWVEDEIGFGSYVVVTSAIRAERAHIASTDYRVLDDEGVATDVHRTTTTSAGGVMPGVGVVVGTPKLSAFSSVYRGYSGPRVSQAVTPDGRDAKVNAERSTNFELGGRGKFARWLRAEADGFGIWFSNQLVSNSPFSGLTSEFVDGGATRHLGAEGTLTAQVGEALQWPLTVDVSSQYTYVRSRFVGGDNDRNAVPYSPVSTFTTTLDLLHPIGVGGEVALAYVGSQFADEANTVTPIPNGLIGRIGAYTTVDANAYYKHAPTGLSVRIAAKNLL
ncbi:MAG: TonB-dependent receptor plug domain-containing protein, partial [Clostridia bacterium]|nr:TonB-dependent receptor plug domain-containing protein [Deltaproteobacteria bacterium]